MIFGGLPIVFDGADYQGEHAVRFAQCGIDGEGLLCSGLRQRRHFNHALDTECTQAVIEDGQSSVGGSVAWIVGESLLERFFRFRETLGVVTLIPVESFQIILEGLDVPGAGLRAGEFYLQGVRDRLRYFILDSENIVHLAVVAFGPEMGFVGDSDELGGDANAISGAAHAAFENGAHFEPVANAAQVALLSAKGKSGRTRDYSKLWNLGEGVQNLFGQAIAEVFIFLVAAQIGEGENGNGCGHFLLADVLVAGEAGRAAATPDEEPADDSASTRACFTSIMD